jgi:hypothetical protein
MTRSASISRLRPEFDDFLFAPIDEGSNGMLLSVLSALTRLEIDPWQEAAELAGLPTATATERLASLIGALPEEPSTNRDPATIASRLITLLPRRASNDTPPRRTEFSDGAARNSSSVIRMIAINVAFMAFLLGAQWIVASRQPPAPDEDAHAPASSTVSTPVPTPSSDR